MVVHESGAALCVLDVSDQAQRVWVACPRPAYGAWEMGLEVGAVQLMSLLLLTPLLSAQL